MKFFLIIVINREYIVDCNWPFNKLDKYCREWYLSHNSDDIEIRMLDDELNNYILVW